MEIAISVFRKVASVGRNAYLVADNDDISLRVIFDAEWKSCKTKVARILYGGKEMNLAFAGNLVRIPPLQGSGEMEVGFFSANPETGKPDGILRTSTPCRIAVKASVMGETGAPAVPMPPSEYQRLLALLQEAIDKTASNISARVPESLPEGTENNIQSILDALAVNGGGGGGTTDHAALTNRDLPDQHPMGAITGLDEALTDRDTLIVRGECTNGKYDVYTPVKDIYEAILKKNVYLKMSGVRGVELMYPFRIFHLPSYGNRYEVHFRSFNPETLGYLDVKGLQANDGPSQWYGFLRNPDHATLFNRDLPNQHSIQAIKGLDAALGEKQPKGDYVNKSAVTQTVTADADTIPSNKAVDEAIKAIPKPSVPPASGITATVPPEVPEGTEANVQSVLNAISALPRGGEKESYRLLGKSVVPDGTLDASQLIVDFKATPSPDIWIILVTEKTDTSATISDIIATSNTDAKFFSHKLSFHFQPVPNKDYKIVTTFHFCRINSTDLTNPYAVAYGQTPSFAGFGDTNKPRDDYWSRNLIAGVSTIMYDLDQYGNHMLDKLTAVKFSTNKPLKPGDRIEVYGTEENA